MNTSDQAERPRVRQCATCPWKVGTVPDRDIPNGYCVDLHKALDRTIQTGVDSLFRPSGVAMGCHYAKIGEEFVCAGWLHNQLGVGNNIGVRLKVMSGQLPVPEVDGEQHERFEDTLPKKKRSRSKPKKASTTAAKTSKSSPMSRESHRQALRQLLERSLGTAHSEAFKDKLVDEILHINKRFNYNPSLDEALNSGDGSYKP